MSAEVARELRQSKAVAARRAWRVRLVLGLGPAVMLAGLVWALAQPERVTLLHPFHQGFWWLLSEPPLFVVLAGLVFRLIARSLAEDLEAAE
jgi:hypothetical protein